MNNSMSHYYNSHDIMNFNVWEFAEHKKNLSLNPNFVNISINSDKTSDCINLATFEAAMDCKHDDLNHILKLADRYMKRAVIFNVQKAFKNPDFVKTLNVDYYIELLDSVMECNPALYGRLLSEIRALTEKEIEVNL